MDETATDLAAMKKSIEFLSFQVNEENKMSVLYREQWGEVPPEDFYIPEYHEGKSVEVLDLANFLPKNATKLHIPKTINEIKLNEWNFAPSLKELIISPENQNYWSDGSALYTKDRTILLRAFNLSLEEYHVVEGTKILGEQAFINCAALKKVFLPDSVEELESSVFVAGIDEKYRPIEREVEVIGIENTHFYDISAVYQTTFFRDNPNVRPSESREQSEWISGKKLIECRRYGDSKYYVPDGIEEIGHECFVRENGEDQDTLEEMILPDSVRRLGNYVFKGNKKLKKIRLSENLENIPEGAFYGCDSLESLYIPASVKEFSLLSLPDNDRSYSSNQSVFREIKVDDDNPNYCSMGGILFSKDRKQLLFVPRNIGLRAYCVPEDVEFIADYAFANNRNLEEICFPNSIISVGEYAFTNCKSLHMVEFSGVKYIKTGAFSNCYNLEKVKLPSNIESIGTLAFSTCTSLRQITLPDGLKSIGGGAFRDCCLEKVVIPKTVISIRAQAFSGCKDIVLYDSIAPMAENKEDNYNITAHLGLIGAGRTWGDNREWHDDYKWWAGRDFNWINHIVSVRSAETEETKYQVLMECEPDQRQYQFILLWRWGNNARFNFSELDKFFPKIKGTNYKIKVALNRLKYKNDLPTDIEAAYIKYLSRISKDIVKLCVDEENIESLELCDQLGVLKPEHVRDCIGYANEKAKNEIVAWIMDYTNKHPVVERKKKDEFALADAPKPMKPKEPKKIDKTSDSYMKKVWGVSEQYNGKFYITSYKGEDTEIVFPTEVAGKKISGIASRRSAPAIYPLLTSVNIPEGYEEIGGSAFADCKALKSISIPQSVEKIGDNAFSGCVSLEKIVIPEKTWLIGKWALRDCTSLKDIYILNPYLSFEGKAVLRGCGNYVVHAPSGAAVGNSVKGKYLVPLSLEDTKEFAQNVFSKPVTEMMLWIEPIDEDSIALIRSNLGGGSEEYLQSLIASHGDGYIPHIGDKVHFEGPNACIGKHGPIGEPTLRAREVALYSEHIEGKVVSEVYYFNNDGHTKVFDVEIRRK